MAQGDGQSGQVVGADPTDLGEDARGPVDSPRLRDRPRRGVATVGQNVGGEIGERREQVISNGGAGMGLLPIGAGQRADGVPQPGHIERLDHLPVGRGGDDDRTAVDGGQLDHVERDVGERPDR